jgi:hypothetical protein
MRLRAGACSIMAVSLAMVIWHAQAQTAAPNLSGNYRCEPATIAASRNQAVANSRQQVGDRCSIDALLTAKNTYLNRNCRSPIRDRQIPGGACSLGAPHIHVAQRRMWL